MRGLLGRRTLPADEGILLRPAGSIHTAFMRFPIDAVFLDRELVVVGIAPELPPWRAAGRKGAHAVLELASGESEPARPASRRAAGGGMIPLVLWIAIAGCTITGTPGADVILGTPGPDVICAGAGNDLIDRRGRATTSSGPAPANDKIASSAGLATASTAARATT